MRRSVVNTSAFFFVTHSRSYVTYNKTAIQSKDLRCKTGNDYIVYTFFCFTRDQGDGERRFPHVIPAGLIFETRADGASCSWVF